MHCFLCENNCSMLGKANREVCDLLNHSAGKAPQSILASYPMGPIAKLKLNVHGLGSVWALHGPIIMKLGPMVQIHSLYMHAFKIIL